MKSFSKILNKIQGWPEKGRRLIAGGLMVASAIILFVSWSLVTSAQLTHISGNAFMENVDFLAQSPLLEEWSKPNEASVDFASPVVSPLNGLWESVSLLWKKVEEVSFHFLENVSGSLASLPYSFMDRLDRAADFAADKLR